jgi:hypothetical protein
MNEKEKAHMEAIEIAVDHILHVIAFRKMSQELILEEIAKIARDAKTRIRELRSAEIEARKEPRCVELQFVGIDLIVKSNMKLDEKKIKEMIADGINSDSHWATVPAYRLPDNTGLWIITDGNHRVEAMRRQGIKLIPVAELTEREFDYVKYSHRTVDLTVQKVPHPRRWVRMDGGAFSYVPESED